MNVIIVAGGLCTRFKDLQIFPKILLPTPTNSSILNEDLKLFDGNNIFLVINEKYYDMVINYIQVNDIKITVIKSTNTNGSFNTLKEIYNQLPQNDLLFIWSDLILKDSNKILNICKDKNIIFTFNSNYRYQVSSNENNLITEINQVKNTGNVPGIYYLKDNSIFTKFENNSNNNFDIIDAIQLDMNNNEYYQVNYDNIEEYRDLDVYIKLMSNEHNFNKFQTRFFNKLTVFDNYLIKEAIDKNYYHLIEKEIDWYNLYFSNTNDNYIVPKLLDHTSTSMKLEYLNGYDQLHSVLDEFEETKEYNKIDKIYSNIYNNVERLGNTLTKNIEFDQFKLDLYTEVVSKVLDRCDKIKNMLIKYDREYLNKILLESYEYILNETKNSSDYNNIDNTVKYYFCHGDLNGSNILVNKNTLDIKFVDPRGYFGKTKMYGWKNYEYAKLLYCLYGYDDFNLYPCIYLNLGYPKIRKSLDNCEEALKLNTKINIILVGIIYVALAGYISQDIMKANVAYDFGLDILKEYFD